jgi:hypothetical protein
MSELKNYKRRKNMKKIILGITAIAVTLLIFGCGRVQSADSGGGGDNNGGARQMITISGIVTANGVDLSGAVLSVKDFATKEAVAFAAAQNFSVRALGNNGQYSITLPAGKLYVVEVSTASVTLNNLAWKTTTVEINPLSTLTVLALQESPSAETILTNGDFTNITTLVESVQETVSQDYASNTEILNDVIRGRDVVDSVLSNLLTAVNNAVKDSSKSFVIKFIKRFGTYDIEITPEPLVKKEYKEKIAGMGGEDEKEPPTYNVAEYTYVKGQTVRLTGTRWIGEQSFKEVRLNGFTNDDFVGKTFNWLEDNSDVFGHYTTNKDKIISPVDNSVNFVVDKHYILGFSLDGDYDY